MYLKRRWIHFPLLKSIGSSTEILFNLFDFVLNEKLLKEVH